MKFFDRDMAALDVNSHHISAIVGTKRAQGVFSIKAFKEEVYQGYADGQFFDADDTRGVIKSVVTAAMKLSSSRTKTIFVSVPAEFGSVITKCVGLDFEKRHRITDADVKNLIDSGSDFHTDAFKLINTSPICFTLNKEDKMFSDVRGAEALSMQATVSYMFADVNYLKLLDGALEELGFTDIRYILSEWAESVWLPTDMQKDSAFALIDIGYLSSSVTIARGDGIVSLKAFSMGGAHIAGDIFEYLNVPFDMAEEAKRLVDLNMKYREQDLIVSDGECVVGAIDAQEIVKRRLDMFAGVIKNILASEEIPENMHLQVYLTGEGVAPIRGVKKYLSDALIRYVDILAPKLSGFVKPEDSSKACLIMMADSLKNDRTIKDYLKSLINGGKKL